MASGKPAEIGITIGQVFLGKYRVDKILGSGGMGVVAQCTHLALNERVAIKMLRSDVLTDEDAVERFTREAQAAAKLRSEYVARVSDVGRFENGVPYMVMEFLEGLDLDQLIDERGCLAVPWTAELMLQTAEALAEAHSIGIVHRDVKPSNLFVTWRPDGTALVKVLDFGISKSAMGTDMQLTQTQSLLGTPAYMSPEQMRSARLVDARTDIWSLGTVMYEVLEGRKPFEADSFSEMCVKVAVDEPAPMTNTPLALQPIILRCLAKAPEQRYPTMADFGRALIPFAQDQHQATLLVERMHRMLRRSMSGWEGQTTNSGIVLQPLNADGSSSSPARFATPAGSYARPHLATPAGGIPITPAANYPTPVGGFTQQLTDQMTAPRKRSIAPWIGLAAAAGIIGITVGVVASKRPSHPAILPAPIQAAKPAIDKADKPDDPVKAPVLAPVVPVVPPTTPEPLKPDIAVVKPKLPDDKKRVPIKRAQVKKADPIVVKPKEPDPPKPVEVKKDPFNDRVGPPRAH